MPTGCTLWVQELDWDIQIAKDEKNQALKAARALLCDADGHIKQELRPKSRDNTNTPLVQFQTHSWNDILRNFGDSTDLGPYSLSENGAKGFHILENPLQDYSEQMDRYIGSAFCNQVNSPDVGVRLNFADWGADKLFSVIHVGDNPLNPYSGRCDVTWNGDDATTVATFTDDDMKSNNYLGYVEYSLVGDTWGVLIRYCGYNAQLPTYPNISDKNQDSGNCYYWFKAYVGASKPLYEALIKAKVFKPLVFS